MSFAAPAGSSPQFQRAQSGLQSMFQGAEQRNPLIAQLLGGQQQPNYGTPQFGLWGTPGGGGVPTGINSQMPGNVPVRPGEPMTPVGPQAPMMPPSMQPGGVAGGPPVSASFGGAGGTQIGGSGNLGYMAPIRPGVMQPG